jgi:hypothetical protein
VGIRQNLRDKVVKPVRDATVIAITALVVSVLAFFMALSRVTA